MKYLLKQCKRIMPLLCVLLLCADIPAQAAVAQVNGKAPAKEEGNLNSDIASGELESFLDGIFNENMKSYEIPGAVISIVKDGKEIFSKGYGYADMDKRIVADAGSTLFRISSITKLFTATAVMQLAQAGEINLEEDVNHYLQDFQIKNKYNKPVTMAQLLTHTSGIDSDEIGDLSKNESEVKPISKVLENRMLPVIREPGSEIQYSNYGMSLAGCIVEEVSKQSCKDYIDQNIMEPLGMKNTKFALNDAKLAQGYHVVENKSTKMNMEGYFNLYPIGGILSTADDMASFMICSLNKGEYDGKHILDQDSAVAMQSRHAGFDLLLPGTCYGFSERFIRGIRAVGHSGYSEDGFSSEICLFPEYNLGIFIAINQGQNNLFPQEFASYFIDRYYKKEEAKAAAAAQTPQKSSVDGVYRFGDYARSTIAKGDIFGAGEEVKVKQNKDGTLTLDETDPFTGKKSITTAKQISALAFQKPDGDYVVFKMNASGQAAYMAQTSDSWHGTYERIFWYDTNQFQSYFFLVIILFALLEIILWIVSLIRRMVKRKNSPAMEKSVIWSKNIIGFGALLNFTFFAVSLVTWGTRLRYGVPFDIKFLLCFPIVAGIMTMMLAVLSVIIWKKKYSSLLYRIYLSAGTMIGFLFIWFDCYWNFMGFQY